MTRLQMYFGSAAAGFGRRCWEITLGNGSRAVASRQLRLVLVASCGAVALISLLFLPAWSVGAVARPANALFQPSPWLYWPLGYCALAALLLHALLPFLRSRTAGQTGFWASRTGYALLTVATVVAFRLPGLAPLELNPDESAQIANALTLESDPRYWRSGDGRPPGAGPASPPPPPPPPGVPRAYAAA